METKTTEKTHEDTGGQGGRGTQDRSIAGRTDSETHEATKKAEKQEEEVKKKPDKYMEIPSK